MKSNMRRFLRFLWIPGCFFGGGSLYFLIEYAFRAYRHHRLPVFSRTVLLGGLACLIILGVCLLPIRGRKRFWLLPLIGGCALTLYELCFGWILLTCFGVRWWDYTGCFLAYRGFICFQFSLCWAGAVLAILLLDTLMQRLLARRKSPPESDT